MYDYYILTGETLVQPIFTDLLALRYHLVQEYLVPITTCHDGTPLLFDEIDAGMVSEVSRMIADFVHAVRYHKDTEPYEDYFSIKLHRIQLDSINSDCTITLA